MQSPDQLPINNICYHDRSANFRCDEPQLGPGPHHRHAAAARPQHRGRGQGAARHVRRGAGGPPHLLHRGHLRAHLRGGGGHLGQDVREDAEHEGESDLEREGAGGVAAAAGLLHAPLLPLGLGPDAADLGHDHGQPPGGTPAHGDARQHVADRQSTVCQKKEPVEKVTEQKRFRLVPEYNRCTVTLRVHCRLSS